MMKPIIVFLSFFFLLGNVIAEDFSFGKVTKDDFKNNSIFKEANAIVLREFGKASIQLHEIKGRLVLRYYYHTKILLINKDGLDQANFTIPLYKDGSDRENIENIKGKTFQLIDGKIVETELEKKNILNEKHSDKIDLTKIALPNATEGSIIELKYAVESPFLHNLESWKFEDYIPKIYSEFITEIPEICRYNTQMKGGRPLTSQNREPYNTRIQTSTGDIRGEKRIFIMENIPAFVKEEYMTAASNFMAKLTFELASYSIPFGPSYNFSRTWKDVDKILLESDNFGRELKRKGTFKDIITNLVKSDMSEEIKAKTIYYFVKSKIKWNNSYGIYTNKGVKKALEEGTGNVADINFALINALQAANIEANPVIISTRDNGFPSFVHPALTGFNYVIVQAKIGDTEMLLDATDPHNPFGQIPHRCINFQGRIVSNDKSDWVALKSSIANRVSYHFDGKLSETGTLKGTLSIHRNGFNADAKRTEIKELVSIEDYTKKFEEKYNHIAVKKSEVFNLDSLDYVLIESHEIEILDFAHKNGKTLNFNPFIIGKTTKNPFNMDERNYPVDLGATMEEAYDVNLQLPESYKLTNKPQNLNLAMPNRDARYLYLLKENENQLNFQSLSSLNKPLFLPDEYLVLKEFYSKIIQSQKIDLQLEKGL